MRGIRSANTVTVEEYLLGEAIQVWVFLQLPIVLIVLLANSIRKRRRCSDASFTSSLLRSAEIHDLSATALEVRSSHTKARGYAKD